MRAAEAILYAVAVVLARSFLMLKAARVNLETRRFLSRRGRRVIEEI